jgi:hypothetical protein
MDPAIESCVLTVILSDAKGLSQLVRRTALPVLAVALILLAGTTAQAGTSSTPVLRVQSNATGEVGLEARGVPIEQALRAIASEAGFEVVITPGIERPPVNMTVSSAPVDYVLRQILRGRNYSLVYETGDALPSEVIVLPPPSRRPDVPSRRPTRFGVTRNAARNR